MPSTISPVDDLSPCVVRSKFVRAFRVPTASIIWFVTRPSSSNRFTRISEIRCSATCSRPVCRRPRRSLCRSPKQSWSRRLPVGSHTRFIFVCHDLAIVALSLAATALIFFSCAPFDRFAIIFSIPVLLSCPPRRLPLAAGVLGHLAVVWGVTLRRTPPKTPEDGKVCFVNGVCRDVWQRGNRRFALPQRMRERAMRMWPAVSASEGAVGEHTAHSCEHAQIRYRRCPSPMCRRPQWDSCLIPPCRHDFHRRSGGGGGGCGGGGCGGGGCGGGVIGH